jgi:hypothetical protein
VKKDYGVKARGPGKPTKAMKLSPEEFFLTALANFGPPDHEPFDFYYAQGGFMVRGCGAWCHYHPVGKRWTELVMMHGEAKSRAHRWYMSYARWWNDKKKEARDDERKTD